MVNPALDTGEVEVAATGLELLSESDTPPFPIEDRTEANEDLRLKYRYLDLRRPEMTQMLGLRHRVIRTIREYLDERGFVDVETPMLGRSTPEGARDFLVPSRLFPGAFYALPQSPQQLKQMLMVAGQDRYYQIVRCFRDEASRADRGFEFTQLDLEMSFVDEEDIIALMEPLFAQLSARSTGVEAATPFPRLTYQEVMDRYGSDKPDLRYGMELADLSDVFAGTGFNAFASVVTSGGRIQGDRGPGRCPALPEGARPARHRDEGSRGGRPRVDGRRGERCALAGREAPVDGGDRRRAGRPPARPPATWC